MSLSLRVRAERLPLRVPFRISRGVKTHADVLVAELHDAGVSGLGEGVPYARFDETLDGVSAQLTAAADRLRRGTPIEAVLAALGAGAARNALDCAHWDLVARRDGRSVGQRLNRAPPGPMPTAVTISLSSPAAMRAAATAVADAPLLKVKLDAGQPAACLAAVAEGAPAARLIIDPNEGWTLPVLMAMSDQISRLNVAMVEQPLPAGADVGLEDLAYPVTLCADESVRTCQDLDSVEGRYQMVNVKLDKAGGLTEALAMAGRARAMGLDLMAGCMVCSSLSIAPHRWVAAQADIADLDGPWWLAEDRPGGCRVENGVLYPPQPGFWGDWSRSVSDGVI